MKNYFRKAKRNYIIPTIFGLFTIGILIILFLREKNAIWEFEWKIRVLPLLGTFIIFSINIMLMGFVWSKILGYLGFNLDWKIHYRTYWISNFLKRIPGTIWYVVGRMKLYESRGIPKRLTTIASGIEYALLLISSFVVGFTFALEKIIEQSQYIPIAIGIFTLSLVIVNPRTIQWILRITKTDAESPNYKTLLEWFFIYVLIWFGNGLILFLIINTILNIKITELLFIIGSVAFVNLVSSALFFAPSNFGIGEVTLSLMLSVILPSSISVLVAIIARLLLTIYDFIWALIGYIFIPADME
ncbi:hypothetical protein [Bellilinea sp.]|uniref:hypothetical protein n=1 Tax=Bellilinea sp. TaxID=2838785 RepID=UPI002ADDD299|nr:hypothetical protein [Bellilinea sp.]